MRPSSLVLVLAAALALAAALFLLLRPGGEGPRARALPTTAERAAAEPERPRADLAAPGALDLAAEPPTPSERVEVAAEAAPAEAETGPRRAERAARRVHGVVLGPHGTPIEGARVLASDRPGVALVVIEDGGDLGFLGARETHTDADGAFELAGLRPGTLRLAVRAGGYAPHEDELPLPDAPEVELAPIVLSPGAVLTGRVVDPAGRPIAGARLSTVDPDAPFEAFFVAEARRPDAVTDAAGAFRLDTVAVGPWRVRVDADEHPPRDFSGLAERAGPQPELRLELPSGASIEGRVTGVPESERGALVVRASRAEGDFRFGSTARQVDVAEDGGFRVAGLVPDAEYDLQARAPRGTGRFGYFGSARSERVRASAGARGVVLAYAPEAALLLQVVDARTDAPVEDFRIDAGLRWPQPVEGPDGRPLAHHPEGRVRVGDLRPDGRDDEAEVRIRAPGYRDLELDGLRVAPGVERDLGVVRLEPAPLLEVRVREAAAGAPVEGARVVLRPEGTRRARGGIVVETIEEAEGGEEARTVGGLRAVTDAEGRAFLTAVEDGIGTIEVTKEGYALARVESVVIGPGAPTVHEVELSAGGSVLVRVRDSSGAAAPGERVRHRAPDEIADGSAFVVGGFLGARSGVVTDAEGVARFEHLAPGVHAFSIAPRGEGAGFTRIVRRARNGGGRAADDDEGWREVTVVEGGRHELVLEKPPVATLLGRVTEAGVPLAGATVAVREEDGPSLPRGLPMGMAGPDARTDAEGRYELEGVTPGSAVLVVTHPTRHMPYEARVTVREGENVRDLDLPVAVIEGRVTAVDGEPVRGVEVSARRRDPEGRQVFSFSLAIQADGGDAVVLSGNQEAERARTDEDGRYRLRGVETEVDLVVRAEGGGFQPGSSDVVRVAPNEVQDGVDLVLERGGALEIEAVRPDGSRARMVTVRAEAAEPRPDDAPKFDFAMDGAARFDGLRPGKWRVFVRAVRDDDAEEVEKEVEVVPGETAKARIEVP